jgi:hypothetical protein
MVASIDPRGGRDVEGMVAGPGDLDPSTDGRNCATFCWIRQALRFTGKGDGLTGRLEREQQWLAPYSATWVSVEKEPLANGYAELGRGSDGALVWLEKKRGKGRVGLRWLCSALNTDVLN